MITLQFSATDTLFSRLIQHVTRCKYSHVEIVWPDGRLYGAGFSNGVGFYKHRNDYIRGLRVDVDLPEAFYDAVLTQRGKPYDWRGALGIGFDRNWQEDSDWFCDELVEWAARQVGAPLLNHLYIEPWRITPRDLLLSQRITRRLPGF